MSSGLLVVKITFSFAIFDQITDIKSGDGDAISNDIYRGPVTFLFIGPKIPGSAPVCVVHTHKTKDQLTGATREESGLGHC